MGTAPTPTATGPKEYTESYVQFAEGEGNDRETSVLPEKRVEAKEKAAAEAGKPFEKLRAQTFTFHEAQSAADFEALVANEAERVNIFNRGYVLKQQGIAKDLLDSKTFEPQDAPYDLTADAGEERERRAASPEDRARKQLDKVLAEGGPDALARVIESYKAQLAQMGGAPVSA